MKRPLSDKQQKKLADDARLLRWWKAWHREQRDEALARYPALAELFRTFRNLEHAQPVQVLGLAAAIDWSVIDYEARLVTLHEANDAICKFRMRRGFEPISDNLPDEPETPFRTIKAILFPSNEGAHRGAARFEYPSFTA